MIEAADVDVVGTTGIISVVGAPDVVGTAEAVTVLSEVVVLSVVVVELRFDMMDAVDDGPAFAVVDALEVVVDQLLVVEAAIAGVEDVVATELISEDVVLDRRRVVVSVCVAVCEIDEST